MISNLPKVYVIVLNYKSWRDTLECLESVFSSDYPNFQVVVVENGSGDQSGEKILAWAKNEIGRQTPGSSPVYTSAKNTVSEIPFVLMNSKGDRLATGLGNGSTEPLIILISERNLGYAGGNNLGIQWCLDQGDFEYIWILNNDTAVTSHCLSRLAVQAEKNNWAVCGSKILYYDHPETVQALAGHFRFLQGRNHEIREEVLLGRMDYVIGTSMLVSRKRFNAGLLPEEYFLYFEEADFCRKTRELGFRFGVALDAAVYHKDGKSSGRMLKEYYFARNLLYFAWKNIPWMLPFSLWYLLVHRFWMKVFNGQFRNIVFLFRGVGDFFMGRLGKRL